VGKTGQRLLFNRQPLFFRKNLCYLAVENNPVIVLLTAVDSPEKQEGCMPASFEMKMKVPFHHLDPLQVVWHGNYFKYFDRVRFGLFENAGIDLYRYQVENRYLFPLTKNTIKHIAPLGRNAEFICRATVTEARYKIVMAFEIRLAETGKLCTRCTSEQVAIKTPAMELDYMIPADIREALGFD